MIRKIETFRDENGKTVKSYSPVNGVAQETVFFSGVVRVRVVPNMQDKNPIFEKDFEFLFPDSIIEITEAFEKFDAVCKQRLDEQNSKVKPGLAEKPAETKEEANSDAK